MDELRGLFNPERVAVVGATERSGSVGAALTRNLIEDFDGQVVPVNPNADAVFGIKAVESIREAQSIDLAVLTVPADLVIDILEDCGETGIRNVVVISAGFSEVGGEGTTREQRVRDIAQEFGLNLVGPNSLGIMSTPTGMNATFGPDTPLSGHVSLLSQSGAFITAVVDWATSESIGFKDIVSLGNKAVLDEIDFLEYWDDDPDTHVIVGYLESIDDGRRFIDAARNVTQDTPVVIIKSGRSEAGARAASSHTGALAGSERAYEAGLRQAGVLRVNGVQELFDAAHILAEQSIPHTAGVAIVTNAGGPGVIATDAIGSSMLELAELSAETKRRLSDVLPDAATSSNPVDILGDADADRFREALQIVLADEHVGAGLTVAAPTAVLDYDELAGGIVDDHDQDRTALASGFMGGARINEPRRRLSAAGIPCHFDPQRAVDGLNTLVAYDRIRSIDWEQPERFDVDRERTAAILGQVRDADSTRLGIEAMDILDAYGIPTPRAEIVDGAREAERAVEEIGAPVAMKVVSPDIVHKTDIGAVEVGIEAGDVPEVYDRLITRARRYQPDATILGVQLQEMVDVDAGVETIVGMNRDPQFGPLVLFGLGGVFVEVLEDTAVRVAPVSHTEARDMTREIRSAPMLRGVRGHDAVAVDLIVETIQRLSQMVMDFPAILELDVNPLVALPETVQAIDVRVTVDPEAV